MLNLLFGFELAILRRLLSLFQLSFAFFFNFYKNGPYMSKNIWPFPKNATFALDTKLLNAL